MKSYPTIQKAIKWGGAGLLVITCAAWAVSVTRQVTWCRTPTQDLGLYAGRFYVASHPPSPPQTLGWYSFPIRTVKDGYWSLLYRNVPGSWQVGIPFWMLAAPLLAATVVAWRFDASARRAARVGVCVGCGYSRLGLGNETPCPECGAAASGMPKTD